MSKDSEEDTRFDKAKTFAKEEEEEDDELEEEEEEENEEEKQIESKEERKKQKRQKEAVKFKEDQENRGIIYISKVPPFMKPEKVRFIMSQFGEVDRIYLTPEGM